MAAMNAQKPSRLTGIWILFFPILGLLMAVVTLTGFPVIKTQASASAINGLSIGQPAPEFTARTLDGTEIRLSDLKGAPIAISFWATWCVPCKTELPELQSAAVHYSRAQVQILTVNAGESESAVSAYLSELNLKLNVLLDPDKEIMSRYGIMVLPVTVWVDSKGVVRAEHIGPLDRPLIDRYVADLTKIH
jgi:cytochrome c biogenesis protein CcmG/thiol:disulfide interchange protein DsbE